MANRKRKSKSVVSKALNESKALKEMTFKAFFSRCLVLKILHPWQENEILAFFKSKDLKEKEDLETYQKTLELY